MTFSALKFSRTRLLALMLVAVLGISAIGVASIASASPGTTAAKKKAKKAKKCKKGYKKSHGKCKKKKSAAKPKPAPATVLTGSTLVLVRQIAATKVQIKGNVSFSTTPAAGDIPAVVNIVTATEGNRAANITVHVNDSGTLTGFSEIAQVPAFHSAATATLTVGAFTTNQVPVK
jgi:hypothetical protein